MNEQTNISRLATSYFDQVPDEIITDIFSYLSLSDRKRTRLVCKRFRNINAETSLTKNDVLYVGDYAKLNDCISPCFTYNNVRTCVYEYRYRKKHVEFWNKYGAGIKSVNILYSKNTELKALVEILNICSNIEQLTLRFDLDFNAHFFCSPRCKIFDFNVSQLKSLNIIKNHCPKQVERIFEAAVNVETFNINLDSFSHKVKEALLRFLLRQAPVLWELGLFVDYEERELLQIFNLCSVSKMTKLSVIAKGSENSFNAIGRFVNLKELKLEIAYILDRRLLTGAHEINEPAFTELLQKLINLTDLTLLSTKISDVNAAAISSLPNLSSLSLIQPETAENGYKQLFSTKLYPKMKYFYLSVISNLSDDNLSEMLVNLPNLQSLRLCNCYHLKGPFFNNVSKKLKLFQIDNSEVDFRKFIPVINSWSRLNILSLHAYRGPFMFNWPKLQLGELKLLITADSTNLQNDKTILKTIFRNCPMLELIIFVESLVFDFELKPTSPKHVTAVGKDLQMKHMKLWTEHNMFYVTK